LEIDEYTSRLSTDREGKVESNHDRIEELSIEEVQQEEEQGVSSAEEEEECETE